VAHYPLLDENNVVVEVIVGKDENEDEVDWEQAYSELKGMVCKRTSYNTRQGAHMNGGTPFRKNYAGIGLSYDFDRDAFIPPKPLSGFIINEETCDWEPPTPHPIYDNTYIWNDDVENLEIYTNE
jgi:hypothetical protein